VETPRSDVVKFDLTEEQQLIERTARDYAQRVLAPRAAARDRDDGFPAEELTELAGLGLLGVTVPERHGGAEAGTVAYSLAMQELARADASVAVAVSVTNMVAELVARFGSDAQRAEHLPPLVGGQYLCGSFALSEPQAGSDPAAMRTIAEKVPGGYRIRGTKQWITSGDRAGLLVVWALTEPSAGPRGISAFLVRGGSRGLTVGRAEEKMGLHGSTTVQLSFDGVEVGEDALLGAPGQGFKLAMVALDGGRIGISSQAIGVARMALDSALTYAREREQFGVPILQHQAIGNMLADCATWLEAARLLTLRAAWRKDSGLSVTREAAMAKLFATERACAICDTAIQVHGGYGYTRDFPVERAYRDVRVTRIYEGTSEIQRIVIARELMKEAGR
jgi:alkylation response protein AidB-like acyl-CoA dehydrogenase